jgi:aromatic ring-opening dioxygenase catalytic subunit (LigB family)
MAELVFAGAMSHAPGATGWPEKADIDKKNNFHNAAKKLGERIVSAKPDVLIGISNDHVLNYNLKNFPNFAIGTGEQHSGPGEWFESWLNVPRYQLEGSPKIAGQLYNGLIKKGYNIANHQENFLYDDNFSVPLTLTGLTTAGIPFVPVMMNCTVPPVISSKEAYETGKAFRDVILDHLPKDLRVAFLATGGLSHEPGGPKYFVIDEQFDRWVMNHLANSDHETIINEVTYEKMEEAGSGGTAELLAWFVVMAAAGECKCDVLSYEAPREWRCGMGVVDWHLDVPLQASSSKGGNV